MNQPFYLSGKDCEIVAIVDDIDDDAVLDVIAVAADGPGAPERTSFSVWVREAGIWLKAPDIEEAMSDFDLPMRSLSTDARSAALIPNVLSQVDSKTHQKRRVTLDLKMPPSPLNVDDSLTRERISEVSPQMFDPWERFEARLAEFLSFMTADGNHLVITFDVGGYSPGHRSSPYVQIADFEGMLRAEVAGAEHLLEGRELLDLAMRRLGRQGWWLDGDVGNFVLERAASDAAAVAANLIQVVRSGFSVGDLSCATADAWGPAMTAERVEALTQLYWHPRAPLSLVSDTRNDTPSHASAVEKETKMQQQTLTVTDAARALRAYVDGARLQTPDREFLKSRTLAIFEALGVHAFTKFEASARAQTINELTGFLRQFESFQTIGVADWLGTLLEAQRGTDVFAGMLKAPEPVGEMFHQFGDLLIESPETWEPCIQTMVERTLVSLFPVLVSATAPRQDLPAGTRRHREQAPDASLDEFA